MKTQQNTLVEDFIQDLNLLIAKNYKKAMSESIKRGLAARKGYPLTKLACKE